MKSIFALLALAALARASEPIVPEIFPPERYQETAEKSPFALATPVEAPAPPEEDAFKNLFIRGVANDYVTIQRLGEERTIRLFGREPHPEEGFHLDEIVWSDDLGKTYVWLKKGDKRGKVEFNGNEINRAPAAPAAPQAGGGRIPVPGASRPQTGVPNQPPPIIPPGIQGVGSTAQPVPQPVNTASPAPRITAPTLQSVGNIPRPGATLAPGTTAPRPGGDDGGRRQRIRVINNR